MFQAVYVCYSLYLLLQCPGIITINTISHHHGSQELADISRRNEKYFAVPQGVVTFLLN